MRSLGAPISGGGGSMAAAAAAAAAVVAAGREPAVSAGARDGVMAPMLGRAGMGRGGGGGRMVGSEGGCRARRERGRATQFTQCIASDCIRDASSADLRRNATCLRAENLTVHVDSFSFFRYPEKRGLQPANRPVNLKSAFPPPLPLLFPTHLPPL